MDHIRVRFSGFINRLNQRLRRPPSKGQSLVELALVLPILILILLGISEGALFMGRYLDVLDMTREAAREASRDDPFAIEEGNDPTTITTLGGTESCQTSTSSTNVNFYYKAACIFSPPKEDAATQCANQVPDASGNYPFCDGFNRYVDFDITRDDVVISAYTITNNAITQVWPGPNKTPAHANYWALSTDGGLSVVDSLGVHHTLTVDRWKYDCQGNPTGETNPHFYGGVGGSVTNQLSTDYGAPANRGYVAVEVYYCYHQILGIPIFTNFVPNPMRIHAYTIMPLPNAQPTPAVSH